MKFFGIKPLPLIGLFFILSINVLGQSQPPPSLKWYKITHPGFKIAFPKGLEKEAIKAASLLDYAIEIVPGFYNKPQKPICIYLNNQTVEANGYVTLAPRHMGWNIHAPQDATMIGSNDWFNILTLHEYRHVVQFDYLNRNLSLILSGLFGESGLVFTAVWAVPMWYYEGDAISSETIYSNQGRGRLPEFEMDMKAAMTGKKQKFTYNQAYLRSYRRYFPNHYYLGYFMHTHVSNNYGVEKWPHIIDRVTKNPVSPYSFSRGLKKNTGANLVNTYRNTVNELSERWKHQETSIPSNMVPLPLPAKKIYTHYRYGQILRDSSFVYLKYGMADAPSIVRMEAGGKEKVLQGMRNDEFLSSNGRLVTWATVSDDIRWGMRNYSDIMLYDNQYRSVRRLTYKAKYVSPAISPSGNQIAAVKYNDNRTYQLDILNSATGSLIKEYAFTGSAFIRTPSWSEDEKQIVISVTEDNSTSLVILNLKTGENKKILTSAAENISKPVFWKNYMLFVTSVRGKNEIHAINIENAKRYIALSGGYGLFNLSSPASDDKIVLESYTPEGYNLYSWKPDTAEFDLFENIQNPEYYISPSIKKENYSDIFADYHSDIKNFKIKKYNLFSDGLKLHSWAILPSNQGVQGLVFINDPLSVAGISGGIHYNQNEKNTFRFINLTYSGLFPVVSASFTNGKRTMYKRDLRNQTVFYQWSENSISANITIPLNLSAGPIVSNFTSSGGYDYIFINDLDNSNKDSYDIGNGSFGSVNARISLLAYKQMALRDFYPGAGFAINANYNTTTSLSDYKGSLISLAGDLYLRGLAKHHSLRLQVAYENQDRSTDSDYGYVYPSKILFFRGYENIFTENITRFSVDYAFPLFYPDLGLGSVLYIKRIRANVFADTGKGDEINYRKDYFSYGADIIFDMNLFRLLSEFDFGVRMAVTKEEGTNLQFIAFQRFGY